MSNGMIFFIFACCILVLSIININIGPIVSLSLGSDWNQLNCKLLSDEYELQKNEFGSLDDKTKKFTFEYPIKRCNRRKGMYYSEHIAFVFDVVIGFLCGLLGFVHFLGYKLELLKITGFIGVICGIIGFILTLIYVIYNSLVYMNDYYVAYQRDIFYEIGLPKLDNEGAFAVLTDSGKYECLFYDDSGDIYSVFAKYSDYHKKQYSYNKEIYLAYIEESKVNDCISDDYYISCVYDRYIDESYTYTDSDGQFRYCQKLYYYPLDVTLLKDISDKFITTFIFSLFICIFHIGLVIFGFFLFSNPIF